ncbi:MAG: hypothetical protein HY046_02985 [Acidobacteria bacterium]|nr:hypothetical protein [Acidobacteriota bacterium]
MSGTFNFLLDGSPHLLASLTPRLDRAFMEMYEAFAGSKACDLAAFETTVFEFLDGTGDSRLHDRYFENFTPLWNRYRAKNDFHGAEMVWQIALSPVLNWEAKRAKLAHKGTPFYFWGMAEILRGELDFGYSLMHRALKEDERTNPMGYAQTPGFYFASLNFKEANQAFRSWLLDQSRMLGSSLESYALQYKRKIDLDQFQERFLANPPSIEAISLLGYVLARLKRLEDIPSFVMSSNFAGQLGGNILFDLISIVDGAVRGKKPESMYFRDHARLLSKLSGGSLTESVLGNLNGRFRSDFDETMQLVLDGEYTIENDSYIKPLDSAIAVAYGIRNRWAHGVPTASVMWKRFVEIKQKAFDVLFLTVDFLY